MLVHDWSWRYLGMAGEDGPGCVLPLELAACNRAMSVVAPSDAANLR
jgi:hypothetical protein